MILHAATIAAFFMDQTQQTQCVPALPESPWKWIIQSVIPVAGGTLIAVWSFVQNRNSEKERWERNQEAAHKQWVRDQKEIEWKELVVRIAEIEKEIPMVYNSLDRYEQLDLTVLNMLPCLQGELFIYPRLKEADFIQQWKDFTRMVTVDFRNAIRLHDHALGQVNQVSLGEEDAIYQKRMGLASDVRIKFYSLRDQIYPLAHKDLKL